MESLAPDQSTIKLRWFSGTKWTWPFNTCLYNIYKYNNGQYIIEVNLPVQRTIPDLQTV